MLPTTTSQSDKTAEQHVSATITKVHCSAFELTTVYSIMRSTGTCNYWPSARKDPSGPSVNKESSSQIPFTPYLTNFQVSKAIWCFASFTDVISCKFYRFRIRAVYKLCPRPCRWQCNGQTAVRPVYTAVRRPLHV